MARAATPRNLNQMVEDLSTRLHTMRESVKQADGNLTMGPQWAVLLVAALAGVR